MARLRAGGVDVVVTDLSMRHPTEGLDLIRQVRTHNPHLPIIMISAVGTFEEGAEASRLGARYVISKSKIDEEIENLFKAINGAYGEYRRCIAFSEEIDQLRRQAAEDPAAAQAGLRRLIAAADVPQTVKGEAYDALSELGDAALVADTRQDLDRARNSPLATGDLFAEADANLHNELEDFPSLDHETREALRTAEFLYLHTDRVEHSVDFSRSIGFSYCFAVENEAKARLRKRLQKFFADPGTTRLIRALLEDNGRSLSVFYHQYLLRLLRDIQMDVTIDNVYQTMQRIIEYGPKYKPDGLKALGIVLLCMGRNYAFRKFDKEVRIENPLGMKGLEDDAEVLRLATLLTNLQHYRNPYIHPEISEMEKLSKIRSTTLECMNMMFWLV